MSHEPKEVRLTEWGASVFALVALFCCSAASSQTVTPDEQRQQYLTIARISTLEWRETQPFLIKTDFQLFDLDGKPAEKGLAEESWGADSPNHVEFNSPSLNLTNLSNEGDSIRTHNRESYLVRQLLASLVRPFPHIAAASGFKMEQVSREVGGSTLECFMVTSAKVSPGTAYCVDSLNRIIVMTGELFVIRRSNFKKFHDHENPMDMELSYEGKVALTMHVEEVDEPTTQPKIRSKQTVSSAQFIPNSVMAGNILKKKNPEYPKQAKKKSIEGSVLITALISKEGTIEALDIVASPDPLLTQSARDAVQTWTYRPYLLNGLPTEVDTTITVNYNLNKH